MIQPSHLHNLITIQTPGSTRSSALFSVASCFTLSLEPAPSTSSQSHLIGSSESLSISPLLTPVQWRIQDLQTGERPRSSAEEDRGAE